MDSQQLEFAGFRRREQGVRLKAQILAQANIRGPVKDLMLAIFQHPAPNSRSDRIHIITLRRLADALGKPYPTGRRQLQYLIAEAIAGGWLVKEKGSNKHGGQGANKYRFLWGAIKRTGRAAEAPRRSHPELGPTETGHTLSAPDALGERCAPPREPLRPPLRPGGETLAPPGRKPCAPGAPHDHDYDYENDHESFVHGKGWQITRHDLTRPERILELYRLAIVYGWIEESEQDRLGFYAAAVQARNRGRNPPALFHMLVKEKAWRIKGPISAAAEDEANNELRQFESRTRRPCSAIAQAAAAIGGAVDRPPTGADLDRWKREQARALNGERKSE